MKRFFLPLALIVMLVIAAVWATYLYCSVRDCILVFYKSPSPLKFNQANLQSFLSHYPRYKWHIFLYENDIKNVRDPERAVISQKPVILFVTTSDPPGNGFPLIFLREPGQSHPTYAAWLQNYDRGLFAQYNVHIRNPEGLDIEYKDVLYKNINVAVGNALRLIYAEHTSKELLDYERDFSLLDI